MKGCAVLGCDAASLGASRCFEGMCRLHLEGFFVDFDPRSRRQYFLSKRRLPEDGNLFVVDDKSVRHLCKYRDSNTNF
jgi:hypothetical protein